MKASSPAAGSNLVKLPERPPLSAADWVQTTSGRPFDLAGQDQKQVNIRDIAAQLSKQCRFAGASTVFYSVAQHCVIVSAALKRHGPLAEMHGLLHDAHEAYTGDITRPVKNLLAAVSPYDILGDLSARIQETILRALRIPDCPAAIQHAIGEADEAALATELRDVMAEPQRAWGLKARPFKAAIMPLAWPRAEEKFLQRFHDLSIAVMTGSEAHNAA